MAKKVYNVCKKCKCEKIENTDKLCESCKRKCGEQWQKIITGVVSVAGVIGFAIKKFGGGKK